MLLDQIREPIEMYIGISDFVSYVISSEPKTINVYDFTIDGQKEKLKNLKEELLEYWTVYLAESTKGVTYTGRFETDVTDIGKNLSNYLHTLLKSRQAIMNEYPMFNNTGRMEEFYNNLKGGLQTGCSKVIKAGADSNVPTLSYYCKGLEGDRTTDWNSAKLYGSFQKGALGAMGDMVDSTIEMFIDPLAAASGMGDLLAMDGEDVARIKDQALDYLDKKVKNGTAEDRSEFAGSVAANIFMMFLMFKGIKKPKTSALLAEESGVEIKVAEEAALKGGSPKVMDMSKYTELSKEEVTNILKGRGLGDSAIEDLINSFDGPIYKTIGYEGEKFIITESENGAASGVFVTRKSAGATATERINNLALPPNNTALFENEVYLNKTQTLLEGKVAAQPEWELIANDGIPRQGSFWQVITDGGKYNGAIRRK